MQNTGQETRETEGENRPETVHKNRTGQDGDKKTDNRTANRGKQRAKTEQTHARETGQDRSKETDKTHDRKQGKQRARTGQKQATRTGQDRGKETGNMTGNRANRGREQERSRPEKQSRTK
jgi:hypothetical protein